MNQGGNMGGPGGQSGPRQYNKPGQGGMQPRNNYGNKQHQGGHRGNMGNNMNNGGKQNNMGGNPMMGNNM